MTFSIQAGSPELEMDPAREDHLQEAVEEAFRMNTEDAIVYWNGIAVRLGYKYDLPYLLEELVPILESIRSRDSGEIQVEWPSDTFHANWRLRWEGGQLSCESSWHSVCGGIEAVLNQSGGVTLGTMDFVSEWSGPLHRVATALHTVGYDAESLPFLGRIQKLVDGCPPGELYRA